MANEDTSENKIRSDTKARIPIDRQLTEYFQLNVLAVESEDCIIRRNVAFEIEGVLTGQVEMIKILNR